MSAATDSVTVLGLASPALIALGAWLKGRAQTKTAQAATAGRLGVAQQETERAQLAHDVALVPELMAELRAVRDEARHDREHAAAEREKCRAENEAMRREIDTMLDALADLRGRHERQGEQLRVVSAELARWHGSIPAGAD